MSRQWCKVDNGTITVAPGALPADHDPAQWLPVVDLGPGPGPDQTGDETLTVTPTAVQRAWANIRPRADLARLEQLHGFAGDAVTGLRTYARTTSPTAAQTTAAVKLLARTVAVLVVALLRPDTDDGGTP